MMVAAEKAIKMGLTVEEADLIISSIFGAPKTGVFGLLDVVGLDLMPHVLSSMVDNIEQEDEYHLYADPPEIFKYMLENKLIGRKGIGGFYKLETVNGEKLKKSINLKTIRHSRERQKKFSSALWKYSTCLQNHLSRRRRICLKTMETQHNIFQ